MWTGRTLYKRPATPGEQLRGEEPITQFGRMCEKLGIAIIAANSAQAKGRIERIHGTHQDRLVKKLRRRGIRTHQAANVYLEREYLPAVGFALRFALKRSALRAPQGFAPVHANGPEKPTRGTSTEMGIVAPRASGREVLRENRRRQKKQKKRARRNKRKPNLKPKHTEGTFLMW